MRVDRAECLCWILVDHGNNNEGSLELDGEDFEVLEITVVASGARRCQIWPDGRILRVKRRARLVKLGQGHCVTREGITATARQYR